MSREFKSENLPAREMNLLVISLQIRVLPAAVQLVATTPIRIETIGHLMIRFGGRVGGGRLVTLVVVVRSTPTPLLGASANANVSPILETHLRLTRALRIALAVPVTASPPFHACQVDLKTSGSSHDTLTRGLASR